MAGFNYVDRPTQRAYFDSNTASRNPLRESMAAKVGLKNILQRRA
jgi:hypothetical protein